jgi:oligosaccharide repeat unit polymerase
MLPITFISITTSVTAGFITFLGLGILAYSKSLYLSINIFTLLVILAYMSFLLGAIVVQIWVNKNFLTKTGEISDGSTAKVSLTFITLYAIFAIVQFLRGGGIPRAIDLFLGGYAHREYLAELSTLQALNSGGIEAFGTNIMQGIFLCFWVVGFSKHPRYSIILYVLAILPIFVSYTSRSQLLGQILVPILGYYTFFRPSRHVLITQIAIFTVSILFFFSWNSAIRLGLVYDATVERFISDTLRDSGNSVEPATAILTQNWRGDPLDYVISLVSFLIPRSIWPEKPLLLYNVEITFLYSGAWPGPGNPIITSTMLGEAWYYFGVAGTFILMVLFGAYAQLLDVILSRTIWTLGIYYAIIYLSFILIRSTFLTYYQTGISYLVAAGIVMFICSVIFQKQNHSVYQVRSKQIQSDNMNLIGSTMLRSHLTRRQD